MTAMVSFDDDIDTGAVTGRMRALTASSKRHEST
jgi:hypothetical protein